MKNNDCKIKGVYDFHFRFLFGSKSEHFHRLSISQYQKCPKFCYFICVKFLLEKIEDSKKKIGRFRLRPMIKKFVIMLNVILCNVMHQIICHWQHKRRIIWHPWNFSSSLVYKARSFVVTEKWWISRVQERIRRRRMKEEETDSWRRLFRAF